MPPVAPPTSAAPAPVARPAPAPAQVVVAPAPAPVAVATPAATSGLTAEYFALDSEPADYPTLAANVKPKVSRVDAQVNFDSGDANFADTDLATNFYVRWTGVLKVPKDGNYAFFTESDDGSRLFIDGKLVVDNGGIHGMKEKRGEVELKAGDHPLKLELIQAGGGVGCKLLWQAEGMEKAIVPATALAPKKDEPAAAPGARIVVEAVLRQVSRAPTIAELGPYRHIAVVHRYEVARVIEGSYQAREILVSHWGIFDKRLQPAAAYEVGHRYRIACDPANNHHSITLQQTVDEIQNPDLDVWWALDAVDLQPAR
jgi:hypothetical protein